MSTTRNMVRFAFGENPSAVDISDAKPCPYLHARQSQLTIGFLLPDPTELDALFAAGCRRLGHLFYLPTCPNHCAECIPIRVPLNTFEPSRSQRRLLRRTDSTCEVSFVRPSVNDTYLRIYNDHALHVAPDNSTCTVASFNACFVETPVSTAFIKYRVGGELAALSILDLGATAVSSVYTCWDPRFARFSLGTYSALWEMRWAKAVGMHYYYLGYWVADCTRMHYKSRFKPHELLNWSTGQWA